MLKNPNTVVVYLLTLIKGDLRGMMVHILIWPTWYWTPLCYFFDHRDIL